MGGGSRTAISVPGVVELQRETVSGPGVRLASRSIVFIAWWPPPIVFGVKLPYLLKDPTISVGVISWLIRVAVNLTRLVQYPVEGEWSILVWLKWILPLTGFWIVKSGIDRYVV